MKKELSKLRMYEIDRALKNPDTLVDERIRRLRVYSKNNNEIKPWVDRAIEITQICHATAERYRMVEEDVTALANATSIQMVERVIALHGRTGERIVLPESVSNINEKAYDFMRNIASGAYSDPDAQLIDELKACYPQDEDLELITFVVATLSKSFEQQKSHSEVAAIGIKFSRLSRGMLYAGFIGHYGGSLDREERADALKDFVTEALMSQIPVVGLATKLIPIYRAWFDLESPPPKVESAQRVLHYLNGYYEVMKMWNEIMPKSAELMETCRKTLSFADR